MNTGASSSRALVWGLVLGFSLLTGVATLSSRLSFARPVTYRDGFRVYFSSKEYWQEASVAYSVSGKTALGYEASWHSREESSGKETLERSGIFRWDQLLFRHNGEGFQASFNSMLGVGYLWGDAHPDRSHIQFGASADAETRKWLVAASARRGVSPQLAPNDETRIRAGFSPFLAEMDQLQAWALAQFDADTFHESTRYRAGPVLRFSYRNLLWEIGALADPEDLPRRSFFLAFEATF
jgi:hypothetical protein